MFQTSLSKPFATALTLSFTLTTLLPATSLAESLHPSLDDRHTFLAGAYFQESDPSIGARRNGQAGRNVKLDDLGADSDYVSWLAGYRWRFGERWSLALNANVFKADGRDSVERSFEFNGQTFEAGASLSSELNLNAYIADVMYSVYKSERAELQVGGGIHAFDYEIKFTGELNVDDASILRTSTTDDLLAPLPNLRLHGIYAFSPRWAVYGTFGWLSANIDAWDGRYLYANVATDYRLTKRLAVGLGYQAVSVEITHEGGHVESSLDITYQGPTLYMSYAF
ncbi:hypothetical protein FV139_10275 [Parahaliea maris]|uniref:Outer membrane protein beta-barrel domain-containing protein n=1 Tax=Parahaliea maris TaxID=2716870 RepID=A0A5C8ZZT0_9GAMM|nr:hypothetical protein [Parahaliea maris]TXS93998.1 hypothetical protein FV139_10275 [Parahaliea maris]